MPKPRPRPGAKRPGSDELQVPVYHDRMQTLTEHLIQLTDHRERQHLEFALARALIELLPIQRVVVSCVRHELGERRWFEVASLDARGGGQVADPLRADFKRLKPLEDAPDRLRCLQQDDRLEVAWAGEHGPRIAYFPLYARSQSDDEGVLEIHSAAPLSEDERETVGQLHHVYRNMHRLLAYSDRDALTGFLNRKSLDDAYYTAVLEELDGKARDEVRSAGIEQERRHRVPPSYWLGTMAIDHFDALGGQHGHLIREEVLLLVARLIGNTFRAHDRLYRLGGEQFAVLFHCPEEALAFGAFERLRAHAEKFHFPQVGRVTLSAGFSRVLADDSPSTSLERAEQALEFARKSGHNKVCSHLDLVRRGLFGETARTGAVDIF